MAKVNLWLRGARGKFAGTSLSKGANGETIAREVVTPSNPNTEKQRFQRAIMATTLKAYSAFSELFDHSFQGKSKGSACQQEFMALNLTALRNSVADDMTSYNENGVLFSKLYTALVLPKSEYPAPNAYFISKGTYNNYVMDVHVKRYNSEDDYGGLALSIPAPNTNEKVSEYAARVGLVPGDIYTILVMAPSILTQIGTPVYQDAYDSRTGMITRNYTRGKNPSGTQTGVGCFSVEVHPAWMRMQVKANVLSDNQTAATQLLSTYFDVTEKSDPQNLFADFATLGNDSFLGRKHNTLNYYIQVLAAGVIRSRLDQDLRSTSKMVALNNMRPFDEELRGDCYTGITAPCVPNSWENATENIGGSTLILESGK